mgnify:CR=1 FL=1
MRTPLPADAPVSVRLRAFADFLDDRLAEWEARMEAREERDDGYARLKTERAELSVIRAKFRSLFEHDLQSSVPDALAPRKRLSLPRRASGPSGTSPAAQSKPVREKPSSMDDEK